MKTLLSRGINGPRPLFVRRRITLSLLIVGAALVLLAGRSASSPAIPPKVQNARDEDRTSNWRQAAFGPAHTGFNNVESVLNRSNVKSLKEVWAVPVVTTSTLYSSPVAANGRVFIGGGVGLQAHLHALDAATGVVLWDTPVEGEFLDSAPAVRQGLVFTHSDFSTLTAYDAKTGAIVWTSNVNQDLASPTLKNGTLYAGSFDGTLNALDAETGAVLWSTAGNCCIEGQAPTVDGDKVFQIRTDGTLTAYDARDGTQLWTTNAFSFGLAASGGVLFLNIDGATVALDEITGTQLWSQALTGGGDTLVAVANGLIFVTTSSLFALDAATGAVVWSVPRVSSAAGPAVANGVVYASSLNGRWLAFDERDGSVLWSKTIASGCFGGCIQTTPIVANGTLYLAGPDSYVHAFRPSSLGNTATR